MCNSALCLHRNYLNICNSFGNATSIDIYVLKYYFPTLSKVHEHITNRRRMRDVF